MIKHYRKIFKSLIRLRLVEEEISFRYIKQKMRCPIHLSIGQEATAIGICENLLLKDHVYSTHRCHSHYLAKGGDLKSMISELHGKETGCCGGRGGSMHLMDPSVGMMMSLPIVSSIIPIAVGAAMAFKFKNVNNISVVFIGDAALEEGVFHESANFASLHELPILFVCENNRFSCFTDIKDRQPSEDLRRLAKCHRIRNSKIDGNNVLDIYEKSRKIIKEIRKNKKPYFLQLDTYRFLEHCGPNNDDNLSYRTKSEILKWKKKDPVNMLLNLLLKEKILSKSSINIIKDDIYKEINEAFKFAEQSKFPKSNSVKSSIYA